MKTTPRPTLSCDFKLSNTVDPVFDCVKGGFCMCVCTFVCSGVYLCVCGVCTTVRI